MFTVVLVGLLMWFQAHAVVVCGNVAYYAPDVMEGVVRVRTSEACATWGRCISTEVAGARGVEGFIATAQWWRIGEVAYILQTRKVGRDSEGLVGRWQKVVIADSCNYVAGDCTAMLRRGIAFEIGYPLATTGGWDIEGWGPNYNKGCIILAIPSLEQMGMEADERAAQDMLEWVQRLEQMGGPPPLPMSVGILSPD